MFKRQIAYGQLVAGKTLGGTVTAVQAVASTPKIVSKVVGAKVGTSVRNHRAYKASKDQLKQDMINEGLIILADKEPFVIKTTDGTVVASTIAEARQFVSQMEGSASQS